MKLYTVVIFCISLALLAIAGSVANSAALPWNLDQQGRYVQAICVDHAKNIWAASAEHGIWRYSQPSGSKQNQWISFRADDGLLDDVYALACDSKGRIWAGTLNHGVSVFNNVNWRNYDVLTGPIGCRIFAIAVSPLDGDVWIASSNGLTRYSEEHDTWSNYTRVNGLSSDEATCLAFDKLGNLYVGTQCDGIDIASTRDNYTSWRFVVSPPSETSEPAGSGLPSNLINTLIVSAKGTIFAGTDSGLATSDDHGATWRFLRGADWCDKDNGMLAPATDKAIISGIQIIPIDGHTNKAIQSVTGEVAIACGNTSDAGSAADRFYMGGDIVSVSDSVNSDVIGAVPSYVYQTQRQGTSFIYRVPALTPGANYLVKLHFVELSAYARGQRIFDVIANGAPFLHNFDVFAAAGNYRDTAVVEHATVTADASGNITLRFVGKVRNISNVPAHGLLQEDYVTALCQDSTGNIWIGHRQKMTDILQEQTGALSQLSQSQPHDYPVSMVPFAGGSVIVGQYGSGLAIENAQGATALSVGTENAPWQTAGGIDKVLAFPSPCKTAGLRDLVAMTKTIDFVRAHGKSGTYPFVATLDDDWATQGDWLGRYGRYWAYLCATQSPDDYNWGAGWSTIPCSLNVGTSADEGDGLRHYVAWMYSSDKRVLELPPLYLATRIKMGLTTRSNNRRESEIDDHGETYSEDLHGPSIFGELKIPSGLYYLSFYYFNKDGFTADNRFRDYMLSIDANNEFQGYDTSLKSGYALPANHARVINFRGGVWKRFVVAGPATLSFQVDRNNSFNAILSAIMLDLAEETPAPYFKTVPRPQITLGSVGGGDDRLAEDSKDNEASPSKKTVITSEDAANILFDDLEAVRTYDPEWWSVNKYRYYLALLRFYIRSDNAMTPSNALPGGLDRNRRIGACYYECSLYDKWEETQRITGLTPARDTEKALPLDNVFGEGQDFDAVSAYISSKK